MGEHASVAGDSLVPFRRPVELRIKCEAERRGNDRAAILETSILNNSSAGALCYGRGEWEREEERSRWQRHKCEMLDDSSGFVSVTHMHHYVGSIKPRDVLLNRVGNYVLDAEYIYLPLAF